MPTSYTGGARRCSRLVVAFSFLATSGFALGQIASPPAAAKADYTSLRMLDARVNLKDSFQRASAARPGALKTGLSNARGQTQQIVNAVAGLKQTLPNAEVKLSNLTGAPRSVIARTGTLTQAAPGRASEDIVRDFLAERGGVFGLSGSDLDDLVALGDSRGGGSGLRMLRMEQQLDGRSIFQSETRFLLRSDGSLVTVLGQMVPNARKLAPKVDWTKGLSAEDAAASLLSASGHGSSASEFSVAGERDGRTELASTNAFVSGNVTARQVYFPLAPGMLVPAWSLVAFTTGDQDWYAIVDAQTGDLLWRKDMRAYASTQDARFRVYVQADGITPAPSPAPNTAHVTVNPGDGTQFPEIAPSIVSMQAAYNPVASQNGWIDDCPGGVCTANQTQTLGNNVLACIDQANPQNVCDTGVATVLDGNGRPTGNPDANGRNRDFLGTTPRDFESNFLPPPQGGNPEAGQTATGNGNNGTLAIDQFRRGVVTHLFYSLNWYHDKLYELGFDEASGNFQQTNFSGMGVGNDRVLADVDDGSGTNNANFSTPPDGTSGRMQMYRFTGPTIDRDGALDAEVFMHEATHGVSNRLIGNGAGLNWDPAAGLGEGWSDFVALSLLYNTNNDDPDARYASGGYATYKLTTGAIVLTDNYVYGIRRFPYSTDITVSPLTWADVDDVTNDTGGGIPPSPFPFNDNGAFEVHNIGEIWANTLWGVRSRIIHDPAGANGDVPTGNHTMLQLTIDALKATPIDTSFTEARDAFFTADCATNACANEDSIWAGFAYRGLGYGAKTPYNVDFAYNVSHMAVHESYDVPYLDVADVADDVEIDDSLTNNNGAVDPGETVKMFVALTNPWRSASKAVTSATAVLGTTTAGVTIYNDTSTYGAINPQGRSTGSAFVFGVDPSVPCGSAIDFTLTTDSDLGVTQATFRLRVGVRSGTDPVVAYTRATTPPLAIPDDNWRGVFDQLSITDDFEIADLNLRINNLTHTFVGDLTAMLRSPDGVGVDSVSLIGGLIGQGGGDNLVNFVVDDDVAFANANDMVQAPDTLAPYSQSWLPVFNSPWAALAGFPPIDPVGTFSRYDGTSTRGTWSLHVSDQEPADTGTLNQWSLDVTPVHFACSVVTPFVNVTATKTVDNARKHIGDTVTYTVVLTNNGTLPQGDNAGDEFTDVLPAALTLVGADADSGTATATVGTNTVTWDGAIAPLGGTVTITITATVNPVPLGTVVSNQGTASYDADGDGTNDSSVLTDDPSVGGATDTTDFTVFGALVTATKTVSGPFSPDSLATYTVILTNNGNTDTGDNAGNEFLDTLSTDLVYHGAAASSGTVNVQIGATTTVVWNGAIPAGGSVTITITGTIKMGTETHVISNQASFNYDATESGTNNASGLSDDPGQPGATDPTDFIVIDRIFADGFEGT